MQRMLAPKISNKHGMTLIEIMIVLAILGAVLAVGVTRIRKNDNNAKFIVRQFGVLGKELRNFAKMKNQTFRLVIEMNEGTAHSYWVESTTQKILLGAEDDRKKTRKSDEEPPSPFSVNKDILKKPAELSGDLIFASVETEGSPEPLTKGKAYIHFFPEGIVEKAVVQITDKKDLTWSLVFEPLIGKPELVSKAISLKDLEKQ